MRKLLLPLISFILTSAASADQLKAAVTTVLLNDRTNNIEVMHRFYLHDTEHAVQHLFNKDADILNSKDTQKSFANYVAEQFLARDLANNALPLTDVGFEVEGKYFWAYQEKALPDNIKGIKLFNGTLRSLWPTQINMVNIEGKGNIRTLYFSENKDWLTAKF